ERLPLDGAYERLAAVGYEYGPAFQGLREAWRAGDDLYAEVVFPAGPAEDEPGEEFTIHPALLDAALHVIAVEEATGGLRLPFSWTGVTIHAARACAVRVHVRKTGPNVFAVELADSAGQPVLTVESLTE